MHFSKNQKGMTLIEIMISLGLLTITLGAMSSQLVGFLSSLGKLERKYEASEISISINRLMASTRDCTATLSGLNINPTSPTRVNGLYYGVENPDGSFSKAPNAHFGNNQTIGKISLRDIELAVVEKISDTPPRYVTQLRYNIFDSIDQSQMQTRPISILVTSDASNRIDSCANLAMGSDTAIEEKACSWKGPLMMFDPETRTCKEREIEKQWFKGTNTVALCGEGWERLPPPIDQGQASVCQADPPPGWNDPNYQEKSRVYSNGTSIATGPKYFAPWLKPNMNGCHCLLANDLADQSTFTCRVQCFRYQ